MKGAFSAKPSLTSSQTKRERKAGKLERDPRNQTRNGPSDTLRSSSRKTVRFHDERPNQSEKLLGRSSARPTLSRKQHISLITAMRCLLVDLDFETKAI